MEHAGNCAGRGCHSHADRASWVLVDACAPGNESRIRRAAERRFGRGSRPRAILLTHGHFDHAGSAGPLADVWGVPIYAHPLELPYLTGRSNYPPFDLKSPGFFTRIAKFFPTGTVDLGTRAGALEPKRAIPGIPDWETIETPDSLWDTVARRKQVCRPPVPATSNWKNARRSVELLASLRPLWIAAGHGVPMRDAADELSRLADDFHFPENVQC